MDVLVTITVLDDDGEELDTVSASTHSEFEGLDDLPQRAFALALEHLDIGQA